MRLAICLASTQEVIGLVDMYDFNPMHKRAGLGIVIANTHQNKGYAFKALTLVINYAFTHLLLHQLYVAISEDNLPSKQLFEKLGFEHIGVKKDWIATTNGFKNEHLYQLIHYVHS